MTTKHVITVLSKEGCHLCETAIRDLEILRNNVQGVEFSLIVLDINDNPGLHDKYWLKIPVVRLDGKDVLEAEDIALPNECRVKIRSLVFSLNG